MSKSNITPESIAVLEGMRDALMASRETIRLFEPIEAVQYFTRRIEAIQAALDALDKVERHEKMLAAADRVIESLYPAIDLRGVQVTWSANDRDNTRNLIANYRAFQEAQENL